MKHQAGKLSHKVEKKAKPVAIIVAVVPVSTMPAVVERMVVLAPYRIDWSIPQNSEAGEVVVRGLL